MDQLPKDIYHEIFGHLIKPFDDQSIYNTNNDSASLFQQDIQTYRNIYNTALVCKFWRQCQKDYINNLITKDSHKYNNIQFLFSRIYIATFKIQLKSILKHPYLNKVNEWGLFLNNCLKHYGTAIFPCVNGLINGMIKLEINEILYMIDFKDNKKTAIYIVVSDTIGHVLVIKDSDNQFIDGTINGYLYKKIDDDSAKTMRYFIDDAFKKTMEYYTEDHLVNMDIHLKPLVNLFK